MTQLFKHYLTFRKIFLMQSPHNLGLIWLNRKFVLQQMLLKQHFFALLKKEPKIELPCSLRFFDTDAANGLPHHIEKSDSQQKKYSAESFK